MKLYFLYSKHSPYMYSDYPDNNDDWARILWITTDPKQIEKYTNRCRMRSVEHFRKDKPHRLDDNNDAIEFEWANPSYHVLVTETDKELDLETGDAFEENSYKGDRKPIIYTLEEFFKNAGLKMWHPDPEYVKLINEETANKDTDIENKLTEYKKLRDELSNRGYLKRID